MIEQTGEIGRLKAERDAVILAHNYQLPEIQDVADIVGDSLELALAARETKTSVIVFCGVDFMAETAKILNPQKKVIMPVREATCPLARQLTPEMILAAKQEHPGAAVVVYVNSTAACKALADIVCTSANAAAVVRSLSEETVIFGPDANLAGWVRRQVPEKKIVAVPADGHCYVHAAFTPDNIPDARKKGRKVVCHPECPRNVQDASDLIASTGGMVRHATEAKAWFVLTEKEMGYRLKTLYPDREFDVVQDAICRDMKLTTLEALHRSLLTGEYEVVLPAGIMDRARHAIERMVAIRS